MPRAYSAVVIILAMSASSSVGMPQVVAPFGDMARFDTHLDHVVPVAVVAYVNSPFTLADPRSVQQEPPDEPLVLGTATLDLRDRAHTKFVFTMTNASKIPIPWSTVELLEERGGLSTDNRFVFSCPLAGRVDRYGTWQPGATVTIRIPIVGNCPLEPQGFVVLVQKTDAPEYAEQTAKIGTVLRKAFEKLLSQSQR
jgi:hypothetical protein